MMIPLREPGQPCGYPFATKAFSISFVKEQLPEQRTTNIRMASPMSRGLSNYFEKNIELFGCATSLTNYGILVKGRVRGAGDLSRLRHFESTFLVALGLQTGHAIGILLPMITGSLKDVTFDQVVEFLVQGVKEGLTLDYKLSESKSIAKVACAFANSFGGTIIVGVSESNEAPVPPFDGLENIRSMKQSIRDTILRLVYPTIWMELADVVNSKTNKGFIIVRVPRSDNAPHAYDNREIYTRYQDRNNPSGKKTQLAELNWIEATIRSRADKEKQVKGKIASFETLVTRLQNRYDRQIPTSDTPSLCCVIVCPEFDISGDVSTSGLLEHLDRVRHEPPTQSLLLNSSTALRTLHDGVYAIPRPGERLPTEQKTLLVFKDDGFSACAFCGYSASVNKGDSQIPGATRVDKILTVVEKFLELNSSIYKAFGLVGVLRIQVILRNVVGTVGLLPPPNCDNEALHYFLNTPTYRQIEGDFEVVHNVMSYELFGGESDFLTELRTRLSDSFNIGR